MTDDPGSRCSVCIDVTETTQNWQNVLPDAQNLIVTAAEAVFERISPLDPEENDTDPDQGVELSLVLGDDAMIQDLNRDYRGKDKPTNVLSFPADAPTMPGEPLLLGDVILACETCQREAGEQGKALAHHLQHLTVHGVLHLLGFDHIDDEEAEEMEALEVEILTGLGIADPYVTSGMALSGSETAEAAG